MDSILAIKFPSFCMFIIRNITSNITIMMPRIFFAKETDDEFLIILSCINVVNEYAKYAERKAISISGVSPLWWKNKAKINLVTEKLRNSIKTIIAKIPTIYLVIVNIIPLIRAIMIDSHITGLFSLIIE